MADSLIYPRTPKEYVHSNNNLVGGNGYGWVFGLPDYGQVSSPECGALPFRTALSGLSSPNCLRGEDWVYLNNWA